MKEIDKSRKILLKEIQELKNEVKTLKKTKNEHFATEDKFKNIVDQINEVIFLTDEKGKLNYVSPASESIFGYTPQQMEGHLFIKFLKKTEIPKAMKEFLKTINSSSPTIDIKLKMRRKNNEIFIGELSARIFKTNKLKGTIGVIRDVTEQMKAVEENRSQSAFIDNLIESSALSTWISDKNGTLIKANPACLEFFGATEKEVIGKYNIFKDEVLIRQGFIPELKKVFEKGLAANIVIDYNFDEVEHISVKNATHKIIKSIFTPITDKKNKVINVICQTMDLTNIKKAEEALKDSEENLRTIFDNMLEVYYKLDVKGNILMVSPSAVDLYGYDDINEIIGKNAADFIYDVEEGKALIKELNENGFVKNYAIRHKRKDGKPFWVETNTTGIFNDAGNLIGRVGVFRDISERKLAEDNLVSSEQQYRLIADNTLDTIWTTDLDFKMTYVNSSILKFLGYTPDEFLRLEPTTFTTEEGINILENAAKYLVEEFKKGILHQNIFEITQIKKDGTIIDVEISANLLLDNNNEIIGFQGRSVDITENKLAKEALEVSEELSRKLITTVPDIIIRTDISGKILFCNEALIKLFPTMAIEDLLGKNMLSFFSEKDRLKAEKNTKLMFEQSLGVKEYQIQLANVKYDFEINGEVLRDASSNPTGMVYILRDITERKMIDNELRQNQYHLSKAQEIGSIGTWELDFLTNELIWTDQNYLNFGIPIGTPLTYQIFLECIHPDDRDYVNTEWIAATNGKQYDIEHRLIVNNEVRWVREKADLEFDSDGKPIKAIGFTQDITQDKLSKEKIRTNRDYLKKLTDTMWDTVFSVTFPQREIEWVNDSYNILGYDFSKYIGKTTEFIFPQKSDYLKFGNFLKDEIAKDKDIIAAEVELKRKNGQIFPAEVVITVFKENDTLSKITSIVRDITKRKLAEKELIESEEKLRLMIDNSHIGFSATDLKGNFIEVNTAICNMIGYTPDEILDKHYDRFSHPDDAAQNKELYNDLLENKITHFDLEKKYIHKNGNIVNVLIRSQIVRDEKGKPLFEMAITENITERKKAEEAMYKSEEKFRNLFNNINVGSALHEIIVDKDNIPVDFKWLNANPAYEKLTHLKAEDIIGKRGLDIIPNLEKRWIDLYGKVAQTGESVVTIDYSEYLGKYWEVNAYSPKKNQFAVALKDITTQKMTEKALKESEEKFKDMAKLLPQIVYETDIKGNLTFVNEYAFKSFGYSKKDFDKGINVVQMIIPEEEDKIKRNFNNLISNNPVENPEYTALKKDGSTFPILIYSSVILKDGIPDGIRGIIIDYSEQKKMEDVLKKSETRYKLLFNAANDAIFLMDGDRYVECNLKTLEMFGCKRDEVIGYSPAKFSPAIQDDGENTIEKVKTYINAALNGEPQIFEWQHMRLNGEIFDVEVSLNLIEFSDGNYIQAIVRDITVRKRAENALRESEERFKALHNASFGGITIHNKGLILECNKGLSKITGYGMKDLIGMDGLLLIAEESRDMVMKNILASFEEPYEAIGIRKNGKKYPLRLEARMIPYKGKDVRVVEFRDITESRKIEEDIKQRMTELEIFNDAAVDRELVINDLRKEINEMREKLGKDAKYEIVT